MDQFTELYLSLDETNSTNAKISLLAEYFLHAPHSDSIWVVYLLSGNRLKRVVSSSLLRKWVRSHYNIPKWLFSEAMVAVGDTGETISLLIDAHRTTRESGLEDRSLADWISDIGDLSSLSESEQEARITSWWATLSQDGIFLLNKIMTGAFRLGVSKQTVASALATAYDIEKTTILHRMMGKWVPTASFFSQLISEDQSDTRISLPYPFFLASPLEQSPDELGEVEDWFAEWKWDGIRSQLVKREKQIFLWSRGEELINHSFPKICEGGQVLPDGLVLDGEILAYHQGKPLAFSVLQRRIGRQDVTDAILSEAPVVFMVYDVLEYQGNDLRNETHRFRRSILDELSQNFPGNFLISPLLDADNWSAIEDLRQQAREELAEGLMLKRSSAIYHVGRKRGDWYKYKVDPLSIDAVLIYAQSGSGKRANLFTAYTFAVWSDDQTELIPIGRAYSGLTNKEIRELDAWIRTNTKQRFGPVRSVDPVQVFELGFDGIMTNERSKSGLSLRFPRMLRWRRDKPVSEADTLSGTRVFLKFEGITEIKRNRSLDDFF